MGNQSTRSFKFGASASPRLTFCFFVSVAIGSLLVLSNCTVSGGLVRIEAFPELEGCPSSGDMPVVGVPIFMKITLSEGTIIGVSVPKQVRAEVEVQRTGPAEFAVTLTPIEAGEVDVDFFVDTDQTGSSLTRTCKFTAISDLGGCCESFSCELTNESECFFRDGVFVGPGTNCDNGCPCSFDDECPRDDDPCTREVCLFGACGQRPICAGSGCTPQMQSCPIFITVDFPESLANGESADLTFNWDGESNFRKTGVFGSAVGRCPEGFGCPSRTITLENRDPFVMVNAFTCRIDGATGPVTFHYEAFLTDGDGLGSNIVDVEFTCVP